MIQLPTITPRLRLNPSLKLIPKHMPTTINLHSTSSHLRRNIMLQSMLSRPRVAP